MTLTAALRPRSRPRATSDYSLYLLVEALHQQIGTAWRVMRQFETQADDPTNPIRDMDHACAKRLRSDLNLLLEIRRAGLGRAER